ncbi:MAG: hypothetical protein LBG69_01615, partial [Zoogloeaceae bacterium]|nr:hypothetical protein [Zoogloeaceae bacterium]
MRAENLWAERARALDTFHHELFAVLRQRHGRVRAIAYFALQAAADTLLGYWVRFCLMRSKQQTTNNKQQTTNNKQQTTNNKQQTTNNKQQTTNN